MTEFDQNEIDIEHSFKDSCIECGKPAVWVRSTQFAGNHPYCKEHAEREKDFGENDSYSYWYKL